ncbi:hypothetical protein [Salinisphaera sp. T31B1]|uniref:hypothetical protein n=1 Tax=Salinisphaera sp. T31B1 TaxID=727963 RepID=UPI00333EBE39
MRASRGSPLLDRARFNQPGRHRRDDDRRPHWDPHILQRLQAPEYRDRINNHMVAAIGDVFGGTQLFDTDSTTTQENA